MTLFNAEERAFAAAISKLAYCNPFAPQRIECEREARGAISPPVNSFQSLIDHAESLARACRARLGQGSRAGDAELRRYEDLVLFLLYHRYFDAILGLIEPATGGDRRVGHLYARFAADAGRFLNLPG